MRAFREHMKKLKIFTLIILMFCFVCPGLARGEIVHTNVPVVTLRLSFVTPMWQQMRFSNNNKHWSKPEPVGISKAAWDLTTHRGDKKYGVMCAYLQLQDDKNVWHPPISTCLIYRAEPEEPQAPPTPPEPSPPVKKRGCLGF